MLFCLMTSSLKNFSIKEDINYSLKSLQPVKLLWSIHKKAPN